MKSPLDAQLLEELKKFSLGFTCESCAHFDELLGSCGERYPNHEHRQKDLKQESFLVFCKSFEMS